MNILLLNQNWFADYYKKQGHKVISVGTRNNTDVQILSPFMDIKEVCQRINFEPDCIIAHDESAPLLFTGFENLDIPTVFYSVDTHHHADIHQHTAKLFDITYVAQCDYVAAFKDSNCDVRWMPLWASRYLEPSEEKKYGAVFVGTLNKKLNPDRVEFFDELQKLAPVLVQTGDWGEIFPYSEIVINQTVKGDLNFRVFEAMMTGALLLTEQSENGLTELFNPGEHLVTYKKGDAVEAAEKIKYYLEHKEECRTIAKAGRDEIIKNHTEDERAARVLQDILELPPKKHHSQSFYAIVPNLLWLSNLFMRVSEHDGIVLLEKALWYITQANLHGEKVDLSLTNYVTAVCLKFDNILKVDLGKRILRTVCTNNPEYGTITMVRIWLDDKFVSRETAMEYIKTLPIEQTPETTLQAAYDYINWVQENDGVAECVQSVMHR